MTGRRRYRGTRLRRGFPCGGPGALIGSASVPEEAGPEPMAQVSGAKGPEVGVTGPGQCRLA